MSLTQVRSAFLNAGCDLPFFLVFSCLDPELYHLMVSTAKTAQNFCIQNQISLFLNVKSTTHCCLLDHLGQEIFLNALQISSRLFVPCYVAFPENMRVIGVMLANQGLWMWSYFQLFQEGPVSDTHPSTTYSVLPANLEVYALAWLLNSPKDGMHSMHFHAFHSHKCNVHTFLHSMCFLKWRHPFLAALQSCESSHGISVIPRRSQPRNSTQTCDSCC